MSPDPDPKDIPDDERDTGGPVADAGEMTRPMHGTARPADGPGATPGPSPDAVDGMLEEHDARRELDFDDGELRDAEQTQGESVVEAEYADRGPAEHLDEGVDASAASDVGDPAAGDRLSGTGLETDADADTPLPRVDADKL